MTTVVQMVQGGSHSGGDGSGAPTMLLAMVTAILAFSDGGPACNCDCGGNDGGGVLGEVALALKVAAGRVVAMAMNATAVRGCTS